MWPVMTLPFLTQEFMIQIGPLALTALFTGGSFTCTSLLSFVGFVFHMFKTLQNTVKKFPAKANSLTAFYGSKGQNVT